MEQKVQAPPQPRPGELGSRARATGALVWSAFLAAALATMICFAFIDPEDIELGRAPSWWNTRLRVYAIGFFFFWLVGFVAAWLSWVLARAGREEH